MPKRLLASVFGFLVLAALGLWPALAAAQTLGNSIAINKTSQSTFLADASGKQFSHAYTPSTTQLLWVNKSECQQNLTYEVSVTAIGIQGLPIEVWAAQPGTDCTSQINRYNSGSLCWRVYKNIAQNGTYTIPIRVEDIVAQKPTGDPNASQYVATANDCNIAALTVPSGGISIALYFYVFSGLANGTPTYSDSWDQFGFDLIGPNPPADVPPPGIADTELHLRWSSVLDPDRAGYHIYCDAASSTDDAGAAGAGGATGTGGAANDTGGTTGDTDAGYTTNPDCPSATIIGGMPPPPGMRPSGSASTITATDAYATGLANGVNYACAISVFDVMGNDGAMSQVVCGAPKLVKDVFTAYRQAGGKGGGGFCSIGRPGSAIGQMIPLACLALLALRRRGRRRPESGDRSR